MADTWSALSGRLQELEGLASVMGVLEWDQQTKMPRGGAAGRGRQLGTLSTVYHEKLADPAVLGWAEALLDDPDPVRAAAARQVARRHRRAVQLPASLVAAQAEATSAGFAAWMTAREQGSFAPFEPALTRLVALAHEVIAARGPAEHPYDHLLEEFDPGARTRRLVPLFDRLKAELVPFVAQFEGLEAPAPLALPCTEAELMSLSLEVCEAMGFDTTNGRLDVSEHPFTVGINPGDVRITTRPHPGQLWGTLAGTIHECGHALYEQGLPSELAGTGLCEAAGTGLHESQSRFWENFIGRSLPFCSWLAPRLAARWPTEAPSAEALFGAANRVTRSLIRIHSDEVTYNLHIAVRFDLERALVTGDLPVSELPGAWDAAYQALLGVRPPSPLEGVLQDVHWSSGLFGYFPSYTVGNLYAASLAATLLAELPGLWEQVEAGDFSQILGWLRQRVHRRGHTADPEQIFRDAVGDRDPVADFMAHLRGRQGALYGVR